MRTFIALLFLFTSQTLTAGTLRVEIDRNGFTGPLEVAVGTRDDSAPEWVATRTLGGRQSLAAFDALAPGLYTVLIRGAQPLQRLGVPVAVGNTPVTTRLAIPRRQVSMHVLLGGKP
ncbi:MAG: hypothetical protein QOJ98_1316, partial [Acidobacteriota bacterium]|nr:hypothetical protein [Acidobacteriota bacterium]